MCQIRLSVIKLKYTLTESVINYAFTVFRLETKGFQIIQECFSATSCYFDTEVTCTAFTTLVLL